MIDAHIHLEQYQNDKVKNEIKKWESAGIQSVIAVSNDLPSSYRTLELQNAFPGFVHAAVGFHPENPLPVETDYLEWETLVTMERKKITAIGEVGLPHYELENLPHTIEQYVEFLSRCLDTARQNKLPVSLHAVHDKANQVFELLQDKQIVDAHFHWLKAPDHVLHLITSAGYYVSVTPEVCYRKRDQKLASLVPLSQLLIETDGPWLYKNNESFVNEKTTPLLLFNIISKLSEIKGFSSERLNQTTYDNTCRCYKL